MTFDSAKHPRGAHGRFGVAGRSVGADRLKLSGVTGDDLIQVLSSRVKKYAGFHTVQEFVDAHPKGKAHALRMLAADLKAGKIGFGEQKAVAKKARLYVAPDRSKLERVQAGVTKSDYLTRLNKSAKYPPGITVGDFIDHHPRGAKYAANVISTDIKAGRLIVERQRPKVPDIRFGADVSAAFKADVEDAWNKIPAGARALLKEKGATFHAPKRLIDTAPELADQAPRGWAPGATWKNVGGCYRGGADKKVIVAETALDRRTETWESEADRAKAVTLHEAGHAIDDAKGRSSYSGPFRQAYSRDVAAFQAEGGQMDDPQFKYFLQPGVAGPSEMYAEMFADRLGHPTNPRHPPLSKRFPSCAAYMDELIRSLA